MNTVAAFDFDGTLTTRDCMVPFLEHLVGRIRLVGGVLVHPIAALSAVARRDRDRFKALAVSAAFAGRDVSDVIREGASFASTIRASWLRADTLGRLEWHQQQGHRVVLVSASLGPYLHPLGAMLGLDAVLCTEVVVGDNGRYTGELLGQNCRGPEKVRRLCGWLREQNLEGAELWAYGDSAGDRELLAAARHRYFVKGRQMSAVPESSEQESSEPESSEQESSGLGSSGLEPS